MRTLRALSWRTHSAATQLGLLPQHSMSRLDLRLAAAEHEIELFHDLVENQQIR